MKKKINFLPILIALVSAGGFKCYLDKDNSLDETNVLRNINDIVDLDSSDYTTEATTYETTASVTTTYKTTTTFITTLNIYKDIMFLYDDNYSIEDVNKMIVKYSSYCDISYDEAVSILRDNCDSLNEFNTLENYIMSGLFDGSLTNGLISDYCVDGSKIIRDMSRDEKESIMIDMCNVMGISNDDKKIILAIFRWETGHGDSYLCVNCNNYGGIKVGNNFGIYQTPEFGMYKAIKCIYGHIMSSRNKGYNDINSIVSDMSYRYCYDTADDWAFHINGMIDSVSNYYEFDSLQYTKKYEG